MDDQLVADRGYLVVSDGLACDLPCRGFAVWWAENGAALDSPLPLGLVLTVPDHAALDPATLANLTAAGVPIAQATGLDIATLAATWALDTQAKLARHLGEMRAAGAALRLQHEETLLNFTQAEDWLSAMLAPKFVQIRQFPRSSGQVRLGLGQQLKQQLPCSSRGLAAIDIHVGAVAGSVMTARLQRWNGDALAEIAVPKMAQTLGWQRLPLARALAGPEEDVALVLTCVAGEITLGLARPVPFDRLRATTAQGPAASPLALSIWAGLPDIALPPIGLSDQTVPPHRATYLSVLDMPQPVALKGAVHRDDSQGSITLRPDKTGAGLMLIREVSVQGFGEVEAFLQMLGDTGAIVTFATTTPGIIATAGEGYRLDSGRFLAVAQFGRMSDAPRQPVVDIVLRIENAHPGAALKLWALKLVAGDQ